MTFVLYRLVDRCLSGILLVYSAPISRIRKLLLVKSLLNKMPAFYFANKGAFIAQGLFFRC